MRIAIIPARGGSKRIPKKNIKNFCGKPMIAYSIEVALESKLFDRVVVSTDSSEIAELAKKYGAEVPFLRPEKISDDFTGTGVVVTHAIEELSKESDVEFICCLYATAPLICKEDLIKGYELLSSDPDVKFSFSATSFPFPIQRAFKINPSSEVEMFQPEHLMTRSQDLEESYHDAGQFYWGKAESFLKEEAFFAAHSRAVLLPRIRVQDIDTPEDWDTAEALYKLIEK